MQEFKFTSIKSRPKLRQLKKNNSCIYISTFLSHQKYKIKYCYMHGRNSSTRRWKLVKIEMKTKKAVRSSQQRDGCSTSWYFPLVTTRGYQPPVSCAFWQRPAAHPPPHTTSNATTDRYVPKFKKMHITLQITWRSLNTFWLLFNGNDSLWFSSLPSSSREIVNEGLLDKLM